MIGLTVAPGSRAAQVGPSEKRRELKHSHSRSADERAERPRRNLAMLRNGQTGNMSWLHKDGVATAQPIRAPAGALEHPHNFRP
jgi:hypothetical protein